MQKINPCLWFDHQAEEAAEFYVSVFPDSRIVSRARRVDGLPDEVGDVMVVAFELAGQGYIALNGGPLFRFSPAISLAIPCETQDEVDHYWARLTEGGEEGQCGWLTDRYGVTWQVTPTPLIRMFQSDDRAAAARAAAAMMPMKKLDIAALQRAFDNA